MLYSEVCLHSACVLVTRVRLNQKEWTISIAEKHSIQAVAQPLPMALTQIYNEYTLEGEMSKAGVEKQL